MQNIYLIGMPGCGKSALGKEVAKRLNMEFVDTDKLVLDKVGAESVNELFKRQGVVNFRKLEKDCVYELSKKENMLVSTGGGAVLDPENVNAMINSGSVVFVDVSIKTLTERIDTSSRPLVADIGPALEKLYFNRYDIYKRSCTKTFDNNGSLEESVEKFVELFQGK